MKKIDEIIGEIENEIGLKAGFVSDLIKNDDWSFLIKSHALIESVCSYLLTSYFADVKFRDIFSRIEMSNKQTGKIAFLRAAGLIEKEEARFIIGLSELRNKIVHNIDGVHFSFSNLIGKLEKKEIKIFAETFGYAYADDDGHGKLSIKEQKEVLSNPKLAIWWGVALILGLIKIKVETYKFEQETKRLKLEAYDLRSTNEQLRALIKAST